LITLSHLVIDALDRGDVAAVEALLAPSFVAFKRGTPIDRDAVVASINAQASSRRYISKRTWSEERVVRKPDALVFLGKAHEVEGGEIYGGYLFDGWYLLQWVRFGDAWRVQLITWQAESTERGWWNDIFVKGRGFAQLPNRLLVETIKDVTAGAALELAMGQGRNALYLAEQGWSVTGVDISNEGVSIAREQAAKRKLALETVNVDIDQWDFGEDRFDLVTLMYAGDHARWIDRIKASLRTGGLFVLEGWAKESPEKPVGFAAGQLAKLFDGYEILRDETVLDVPDWVWDEGVARKR
jgi:SAM-dependent methyltransferase